MALDYSTIERGPGAFQQPVSAAQIRALCERAFGPGAQVRSARELGSGEYNSTYLVDIAGRERVVLRVAPPPTAPVFWHEEALLRREQTARPFLAPIAPLLPQTLMADFTRQVVERDYAFQTFMDGEVWSAIADELTPADDEALWRQLARIARAIHGVRGDAFGFPYPGRQFPTWSEAVTAILDEVVAAVHEECLDAAAAQAVLQAARAHAAALDEIAVPRLTHGDLWPFNVLVRRGENGPAIAAVLDADRAWWCDPLADWTVHLLGRASTPRARRNRAIFWDEYGQQEDSAGARFRALVYDGMHVGTVLAWSKRHGRHDTVAVAHTRLREIAAALHGVQ